MQGEGDVLDRVHAAGYAAEQAGVDIETGGEALDLQQRRRVGAHGRGGHRFSGRSRRAARLGDANIVAFGTANIDVGEFLRIRPVIEPKRGTASSKAMV